MATKPYLYAVQLGTGHEVLSATVEVENVTEVTATREGEVVVLAQGEKELARGEAPADAELYLHRWTPGEKTAKPVSHKIK